LKKKKRVLEINVESNFFKKEAEEVFERKEFKRVFEIKKLRKS
jgi:ribosomal protein S10